MNKIELFMTLKTLKVNIFRKPPGTANIMVWITINLDSIIYVRGKKAINNF